MAELTPMMQQYFAIKADYKDALLFYRLGDFYEMFYEDAKIASRELELVLTGRDCGQEERAPMCGVPFHSADTYIARLVAKGYKVAICEQTEDPALAKGIVKRDVIRVVTPGTVTESLMLDEDKNNYLAVLYCTDEGIGVSFTDVSTGSVSALEFRGKDATTKAVDALARFSPTEVVANRLTVTDPAVKTYINQAQKMMAGIKADSAFDYEPNAAVVEKQFGKSIQALGLGGMPLAVSALGAALTYLYDAEKNGLENITEVQIPSEERCMHLSAITRANLELTETLRRREKRGSLLWVLDKTKTAMGKRKLRQWVCEPLTDVSSITARQNAVEELYADPVLRGELADALSSVNDLERATTRVVYGTVNPKELRSLGLALKVVPTLKELLSGAKCNLLKHERDGMDEEAELVDLLDRAIADDPPFSVREGGMIKDGYNEELDSLRQIVNGGTQFLEKLLAEEQERTGIKKLKIGYNKVFGYYLEVLNTYRDMVPENYIRKQTLTNCERYITPQLKELEAQMLGAQDRIAKLEYALFCEVRSAAAARQETIRRTGDCAAALDVLCSLARVAEENGYVRPVVDYSDEIVIKDGRHPVVEQFLDGLPFVPNDTVMDGDARRTVIITGPNMAGKSTYMRQTALIVLMAQIGSFVPAASATVGIADSIFTRIGAADDLTAGQSTFMTEMNEVSAILANATSKSLIILDEIGRGTSTFDGMSIARAVLEYVNDKKRIGARTLFATHYHELTEIENELEGVVNCNTSVKKRGDEISFLRRIVPGPADGSYGIEVAKLAGVPQTVVKRARVILNELEAGQPAPVRETRSAKEPEDDGFGMPGLFANQNSAVAEELRNLDLNTFTPLEALTKLYELKSKIV